MIFNIVIHWKIPICERIWKTTKTKIFLSLVLLPVNRFEHTSILRYNHTVMIGLSQVLLLRDVLQIGYQANIEVTKKRLFFSSFNLNVCLHGCVHGKQRSIDQSSFLHDVKICSTVVIICTFFLFSQYKPCYTCRMSKYRPEAIYYTFYVLTLFPCLIYQ